METPSPVGSFRFRSFVEKRTSSIKKAVKALQEITNISDTTCCHCAITKALVPLCMKMAGQEFEQITIQANKEEKHTQ